MSWPSVLIIIMCSNAHFHLQVADLLKSSSIKFIIIFLLIPPPTLKSKNLQHQVLINAIQFIGQICQQSGSSSKAGDPSQNESLKKKVSCPLQHGKLILFKTIQQLSKEFHLSLK